MNRHLDIKGINEEIEKILIPYVRIKSFTNTVGEKDIEDFFRYYFSNKPYFQKNEDYYGTLPIKDDPLNRSVSWALVKGSGCETVVLIHHSDIVSIEDFRNYKEYALSPYELEKKLRCIIASLPADVSNDLESGDYLFGRGVCDMKGGGSIQIALMNYYSKISDLKGNLVLLVLPDEENLSAGMRSGVVLLRELQNKYNLNYKLMINSEPHQRKQKDIGVFSIGSIGKLMPFIYVRGFLAHAGKVFEGLNPLNVMSGIVRATELNSNFSDTVFSGEASPPPTWLYFKDSKEHYDVSMPLFAYGCISVQTMKQTPKEVLDKIKIIAEGVFKQVLNDTQKSYDAFCEVTGVPQQRLPWSVKVISIGEFLKDVQQNLGNEFNGNYNKIMDNLFSDVKTGK
ncbi:M20/M25/M40 family metallo-hydrolase, partial [Synergistes jonesii]